MGGDASRGVRLLGAAPALVDMISAQPEAESRATLEQGIVFSREQLGEEVFTQAWAEGPSISMEEAIALALQSGDKVFTPQLEYGASQQPGPSQLPPACRSEQW